MRRLLSLTASLAISACHADATSAPLSSRAELCSKRDSLVASMMGTTIDDHFELLAKLLPGGFGGVTASFMYLKQPSKAGVMREAAHTLETCPGPFLPYLFSVQAVPVRQGSYDWVELRGWYRTLQASLPVTWNRADMDESLNRLAFGFSTDSALATFRMRSLALGVPENALALSIQGGVFVGNR